MATPLPEEQIQPTAPVAPVADAAVAPVTTVPTLATVRPTAVYAAPNIQQIDIPSTKKAMDMKLADLEKKLAKANKIEELNQISILNQPKAMGVLTGEAAYRSKLDTARINAFNSLYNNRILEEQRKEKERQDFISTYGADPKLRPSGMSRREFARALQAGQFSNLLTLDYKTKQADLASKLAPAKATATEQIGSVVSQAQTDLQASKGSDGFVNPGVYMKYRAMYAEKAGDVSTFDQQFASWLSPQEQERLGVSIYTPEQRAKIQETKQAEVDTANAVIPSLERRVADLDKVTGRGVGAGITGFVERNIPSPTGAKTDNITLIKSIIGQETLQALLDLKAKGGTLGAISEKELEILQSSATRIGAAMKTDRFGRTYVNMSEKEFFAEIDRMKQATQRVLSEARKTAGVSNNDPLGLNL